MDATKKTKIPHLCAHKATGQSFIRIAGRAIYFGKTGLSEATQKSPAAAHPATATNGESSTE